jgi:hypothetical protein
MFCFHEILASEQGLIRGLLSIASLRHRSNKVNAKCHIIKEEGA